MTKVTLIECGSTMDGYGNTCFFNSLREQLRRLDVTGKTWTLNEFITAGEFSPAQRGQMVDLETHRLQISKLAKKLAIKIDVYSHAKNGGSDVIHAAYTPFGLVGPTVLICKIEGVEHYNAFAWVTQPRHSNTLEQARSDAVKMLDGNVAETDKETVEIDVWEAKRIAQLAWEIHQSELEAERRQIERDEAFARRLAVTA
jgi:hypothetical protein